MCCLSDILSSSPVDSSCLFCHPPLPCSSLINAHQSCGGLVPLRCGLVAVCLYDEVGWGMRWGTNGDKRGMWSQVGALVSLQYYKVVAIFVQWLCVHVCTHVCVCMHACVCVC